MNTKLRVGVLMGAAVLLMGPYFAFVLHFSSQSPEGTWPSWVANTAGVWFIANFLVLVLIARRLGGKQTAEESGATPTPKAKTKRAILILRIWSSYLVLLWSVFFLVVVKGTIDGKYPLARTLPAGAFLLFFIGIFGWGVYRSFRKNV